VSSALKIYVQLEHTVTLVRVRALNAVMPLLDSIKIKQEQQAVKFVQLVMNVLKLQSQSALLKILVLTTIAQEINEPENPVPKVPTTTKTHLLLQLIAGPVLLAHIVFQLLRHQRKRSKPVLLVSIVLAAHTFQLRVQAGSIVHKALIYLFPAIMEPIALVLAYQKLKDYAQQDTTAQSKVLQQHLLAELHFVLTRILA